MSELEKITTYVTDLFSLYCMDDDGFLHEYDCELNEVVKIPLFRDGMIDNDTIERVSTKFGITAEEIKNTDKKAAKRYYNKYSFFRLYRKYLDLWNWNCKYKDPEPSAEERIINAIFTNKKVVQVRQRYNLQSVKERLIKQLKEYDSIIPGTYHEGAEITRLQISTETLFSFPECLLMIQSFLEIVDRLEILFYKTIDSELESDEINEMNFLANWLCACDKVTSNTIITYKNVKCCREIYKEEKLGDFYEYVIIKEFFQTAPWRCQEFFDDFSLVQRFVNVFPQTKSKMRDFGMNLSKFSCSFVWSDAKPIQFTGDEEIEELVTSVLGDKEIIPIEEQAKEQTHIYVDKNRSELYGWGNHVKKLKEACGPVSKGGVEVPVRKPIVLDRVFFERMQKRIRARSVSINNG